MKTIKDYLYGNVNTFEATKTKNIARMTELTEQSKEMQQEYNILDNSNKLIDQILLEIKQLQEGDNNVGNQENIQST